MEGCEGALEGDEGVGKAGSEGKLRGERLSGRRRREEMKGSRAYIVVLFRHRSSFPLAGRGLSQDLLDKLSPSSDFPQTHASTFRSRVDSGQEEVQSLDARELATGVDRIVSGVSDSSTDSANRAASPACMEEEASSCSAVIVAVDKRRRTRAARRRSTDNLISQSGLSSSPNSRASSSCKVASGVIPAE